MSDASADPGGVARQIVRVIGLPQGQRPFRVHVDPRHGDAEKALNLGDHIRTSFFKRIGFDDLLTPRIGR